MDSPGFQGNNKNPPWVKRNIIFKSSFRAKLLVLRKVYHISMILSYGLKTYVILFIYINIYTTKNHLLHLFGASQVTGSSAGADLLYPVAADEDPRNFLPSCVPRCLRRPGYTAYLIKM